VDTVYKGKVKSHWREFEFMLHQVQQVTETKITLNNIITKWDEIRKNLAENTRKRKLQMEIESSYPLG
jgi:hypothetical protein